MKAQQCGSSWNVARIAWVNEVCQIVRRYRLINGVGSLLATSAECIGFTGLIVLAYQGYVWLRNGEWLALPVAKAMHFVGIVNSDTTRAMDNAIAGIRWVGVQNCRMVRRPATRSTNILGPGLPRHSFGIGRVHFVRPPTGIAAAVTQFGGTLRLGDYLRGTTQDVADGAAWPSDGSDSPSGNLLGLGPLCIGPGTQHRHRTAKPELGRELTNGFSPRWQPMSAS